MICLAMQMIMPGSGYLCIQSNLLQYYIGALIGPMQESCQPNTGPNSQQSPVCLNSNQLPSQGDQQALRQEKWGQELTDQLSLQIQIGYYKTMEFVYKSWNYNTEIIKKNSYSRGEESVMRDERDRNDEAIYLPQVGMVGNIHRLEDFKLTPDQKTSNIMKVTFKSTYDNKEKYVLITKSEYKANYVKHFNRMMKNKNEKYILTHLHPVLYLSDPNEANHQLYFLLQPVTQLIHITEQYYNSHIRPIERIPDQDFKFSNIRLSKIYSVDELDKNCKDGFVLAQIRQKFDSREKENLAVVGLISSIDQPQHDNNSRNKKELVVWMTETMYRGERPYAPRTHYNEFMCNQIGRCKLIIRYSPSDEQYIESLLVPNCVYFIADPEVLVTENVNIVFIVNIAKNNARNCCIFRIKQMPYEGVNFGDANKKRTNPFSLKEVETIFGIKLQTIKINSLLQKCINRNLVKLEVGLLQVEVLYGSIRCPKCGIEIKRNGELQRIALNFAKDQQSCAQADDEEMKQIYCRSQHKQIHCLQLWGTVRAADETGSCLLSLEHKEIIKFLELEQYYQQIEKCITENGKGMVLMSSYKSRAKQEEDTLFVMKNRLRKAYVEKIVVGYPKTELDKTFRQSLTQEEQLEYQASFQNSKKYLQQKKIFPNGIIEKRSEEMLLLPFIKAMEVIDVDW